MGENPLHRLYNRARLDDRLVNELIGLARGITADGVISIEEARYLEKWVAAHTAVISNPLVAALYQRVREMLADRVLDEEERRELFETLKSFSAGDFETGEWLKATQLPLDRPPPPILFRGRCFCFTGTFAYGSRRDCEAAVLARGGSVGGLRTSTHYLVVGIYATESWAHSSYGRKIEQAVRWRSQGRPIAIVGERDWVRALDS